MDFEAFLEVFLPPFAVIVFVLVCIWAIRKNPTGRKTTTYYASKDVFRKEICPTCGCKMKKTWEEEAMYKMGLETVRPREFEASPVFTCKKCGYKIEN